MGGLCDVKRDRDWWPNLRGRTAVIMASGASLTRAQCDLVRGTDWYSIAINRTWRIAPWADCLYACDWQWWQGEAPPHDAYGGLRVVGFLPGNKAPSDFDTRGLHYIPVRVGEDRFQWVGDYIGSGRNSAFQATNMAARWGAKRIVLLGVDCRKPNEYWDGHGAHSLPHHSAHDEALLNYWIKAWRDAAPDIEAHAVRVINCSPGSAVKAFRRAALADVIAKDA